MTEPGGMPRVPNCDAYTLPNVPDERFLGLREHSHFGPTERQPRGSLTR
jgi:hypothetical protein